MTGTLRRAALAAAVLGSLGPFVSSAFGQQATVAPGDRLATMGVRDRGSTRTFYYIRLDPSASGSTVAATNALKTLGARPIDPGELAALGFDIIGGRWPQFFTPGRRDDRVVQHYNPDGAPIPDDIETIVRATEATWTDVRSSRFRFEYGGLTPRVPTEGDGFNDIGWRPLPRGLGVTAITIDVIAGAFLDADILLNPSAPWTTDDLSTPPSIDVETVLVHEQGHALGLDHVGDPAAVMYPSYVGVVRALAHGDIAGITFLYPRRPVRTLTRRDPSMPFRHIATLDAILPSGTAMWGGFEPGGLNNRGDVAFTVDLDDRAAPSTYFPAYGQAVFKTSHGVFTQIARTEQQAPGNPPGVTFYFGVFGASALNNRGDVAFAFSHGWLFGDAWDIGVYRYNSNRGLVEPLVIPWLTPAIGCSPLPEGWTEPPCVFAGGYDADINDRGDVAFVGQRYPFFDVGSDAIFVARGDAITPIVFPAEATPHGGVFDSVLAPSINDAGDVAFEGHRWGDDCIERPPWGCRAGVYLRRAGNGSLEVIAGQDAPAPGGVFRHTGRPRLNNRNQVLFSAEVLSSGAPLTFNLGLYLWTNGTIQPLVTPGTLMPGGGRLTTVSYWTTSGPLYSINDNSVVAFDATLDTDDDGDGTMDTGVYVWDRGTLRVVARTGTVVPGLGVISMVQDRRLIGSPQSAAGAVVNGVDEVLFQAILDDGRVVLLVAKTK